MALEDPFAGPPPTAEADDPFAGPPPKEPAAPPVRVAFPRVPDLREAPDAEAAPIVAPTGIGVPSPIGVMGGSTPEQTIAPIPMVKPEYRAGVQRFYDVATPAQRADLMTQPTLAGVLAGNIGAGYDTMDQRTGVQPGDPINLLDTRAETRARRLAVGGADPQTAVKWGRGGAIRGDVPGTELGEAKPSDIDPAVAQFFALSPDDSGIALTAKLAMRGFAKANQLYRQQSLGLAEAVLGDTDAALTARRGIQQAQNVIGAIGEPPTQVGRWVEGAVTSIANQLPGLMGGMVAGEATALGSMFMQSYGQEMADPQNADMGLAEKHLRSSIYGAFEVLGEKAGLGKTLEALKMATRGVPTHDLARTLAHAALGEIHGEELTYVGQFLTDKGFGRNPEAGLTQFLQGAADTLGQTVTQSLLMSGGTSGLSKGVAYATSKAPALSAAVQAEDARQQALSKARTFWGDTNAPAEPAAATAAGVPPTQGAAPPVATPDSVQPVRSQPVTPTPGTVPDTGSLAAGIAGLGNAELATRANADYPGGALGNGVAGAYAIPGASALPGGSASTGLAGALGYLPPETTGPYENAQPLDYSQAPPPGYDNWADWEGDQTALQAANDPFAGPPPTEPVSAPEGLGETPQAPSAPLPPERLHAGVYTPPAEPLTPAQQKKRDRAEKAAQEYLATGTLKGDLSNKFRADYGGDKGVSRLFAKTGMDQDKLGAWMVSHGYLPPDTAAGQQGPAAVELVNRMMRGEPIHAQYAEGGRDYQRHHRVNQERLQREEYAYHKQIEADDVMRQNLAADPAVAGAVYDTAGPDATDEQIRQAYDEHVAKTVPEPGAAAPAEQSRSQPEGAGVQQRAGRGADTPEVRQPSQAGQQQPEPGAGTQRPGAEAGVTPPDIEALQNKAWRDLTPEEIARLDAYTASRPIEEKLAKQRDALARLEALQRQEPVGSSGYNQIGIFINNTRNAIAQLEAEQAAQSPDAPSPLNAAQSEPTTGEKPSREEIGQSAEGATETDPVALSKLDYNQLTREQQRIVDDYNDEQQQEHADNLFAEPEKTVRAADEANRTGTMPKAEADAIVAQWKEAARAQIEAHPENANKTVLSLFDYSGEWSKPWREAGYNVVTVDIQNGQDIREFDVETLRDKYELDNVDVVLAAVPCTDFAASGARWWADKDKDGITEGSIELAYQAIRTVEYFAPQLWSFENPVGRFQKLTQLPAPRLIFNPHNYGDPYTKRTLLWGQFNPDLPQANVEPTEGSRIHKLSSTAKEERSLTPEGFAYSFFMANGGPDFGPVQWQQQAPAETQQAPDEPLLQSYTPEQIRQQQAEADARKKAAAEAERKAAEREAADAEVGSFQLTGSDHKADDPNQVSMFDALGEPSGVLLDQLADAHEGPPPMRGGSTPQVHYGVEQRDRAVNRAEASLTPRPSSFDTAWHDAGVDPAQAKNLDFTDQWQILKGVYQSRYGIPLILTKGANYREALDEALDTYHNLGAMMHLLGLPDTFANLGGRLKIAMEPLGDSLGSYHPGTHTLALNGRSNSLAHEWGHALDHWIFDQLGVGTKMPMATFQQLAAGGKGIPFKQAPLSYAVADVINAMYRDQAQLAAKLQALEAKVLGKAKHKQAMATLMALQKGQTVGQGQDVDVTEFAKGAAQWDAGRGQPYWFTPFEMWSRSFEAYVAHLSAESGRIDEDAALTKGEASYLGKADDAMEQLYPQEGERDAIFAAFANLMGEVATEANINLAPMNFVPGSSQIVTRLPGDNKQLPGSEWTRFEWRNLWKNEVELWRDMKPPAVLSVAQSVLTTPANAFRVAQHLVGPESGLMTSIAKQYKSPTVRKLGDMLYRELQTGREQGGAYYSQAVHMHAGRVLNDVAEVARRYGLDRKDMLDAAPQMYLRAVLSSAESQWGQADVRERMKDLRVAIPQEQRARIEAAAGPLRDILNNQWYYLRRSGLNLGSTINGYMPRTVNYEAVWERGAEFRKQAGKVYGILFDNDVGTDAASWDWEQAKKYAHSSGFTFGHGKRIPMVPGQLSQKTAQGLVGIKRQMARIRWYERHVAQLTAMGEDTDKAIEKLLQAQEDLTDMIEELLPDFRHDYSDAAAERWRLRISKGNETDYETVGPDAGFVNSRKLPPETDTLLADFYLPPLDAIRNYIEHSTRKATFNRMFGRDQRGDPETSPRKTRDRDETKLDQMFTQIEAEGVPGDVIRMLRGMVHRATGRVQHDVPVPVMNAINWTVAVTNTVLLARSLTTNLTEPVVMAMRTQRMRDLVTTFGYQLEQAFLSGKHSVQHRRQLAEAIGAVVRPFDNDSMANSLAGDSISGKINRLQNRFFENILLGPLTRSQRTAAVPGSNYFLSDLARAIHDANSKGRRQDAMPARIELAELGIPHAQQADFAKWLVSFEGQLPPMEKMIDARTNDFGGPALYYAIAMNTLITHTIVEAESMDKPALSKHPVARLTFGISSFNYASWNKVYKPNIRRAVRQGKGVFSGTSSWGENRAEAALGMGKTLANLFALYTATVIMTAIRTLLFSKDKWDEEKRKGTLGAYLLQNALFRMGPFGPLDPVYQAFTGIKYERDLTALLAGPQAGTWLQNIQDAYRGIGGSDYQHYKAWKAVYMMTAATMSGVGTALMPSGSIAGVLAGFANSFITSSAAGDAFASAVGSPRPLTRAQKYEMKSPAEKAASDRAKERRAQTKARKEAMRQAAQ